MDERGIIGARDRATEHRPLLSSTRFLRVNVSKIHALNIKLLLDKIYEPDGPSMAPRSRSVRPTQNGHLNTIELTNGNNLPPPSTIAAQIVHNRANVARQEPENKALFGKLLQEYLRDPIAEDSSVETYAQLIQVVAEAGLDVMLSDDPFAPGNLLD